MLSSRAPTCRSTLIGTVVLPASSTPSPRLPASEPGHVELPLDARVLAVVVVDAADVGDDLAGRGVDRHQRPVIDILVAHRRNPFHDLGLGLLLQRVVEGGNDPVAAGADGLVRVRDAHRRQDARHFVLHRNEKCGSRRTDVTLLGFISSRAATASSCCRWVM